MNIHEYQTKVILRHYGIVTPDFAIVSDVSEVETALAELGLTQAVLKVQVHAGGRGKAGGVKIAKSPASGCGNSYAQAQSLLCHVEKQHLSQDSVSVPPSFLQAYQRWVCCGHFIPNNKACRVCKSRAPSLQPMAAAAAAATAAAAAAAAAARQRLRLALV